MMRPRAIRRLFSLRTRLRRGVPWVLTSRSRRNLVYHFVGIQPNEGVGREGMSGAIIGMHMHDKTSTTAHSKDRQQHTRTIKTGTSAFKRAGRVYSASLATGAQKSTPGSPMPPPWNGRGAVVRGEKVGNTGRALAWCVAYQILG